MNRITLKVNGRQHDVDVEPDTPLLWVMRDNLGLTGTKFGCGIGTVRRMHGPPRRQRRCGRARSRCRRWPANLTTIEGLSPSRGGRACVQRAWIAEQVPQCGYCQSGQIMAAAALLAKNAAADRRRHRRRDDGQHLPLRHVSADPPRDPRAAGVRARRGATHDTQSTRLSLKRARPWAADSLIGDPSSDRHSP